MTYQELVEHFGSPGQACRALGIARQVLHDWKRRGIPWLRQCEIEVTSGGALKAERPTPEAAEQQQQEAAA